MSNRYLIKLNDKEKEVYVKLLKLILASVGENNPHLDVEGEGQRLCDWFQTCDERRFSLTIEDGSKYMDGSTELTENNKLTMALRECLLNYRWEEAHLVLIQICETPTYRNNLALLRVGMEVINRLSGTSKFLDTFVEAARMCPGSCNKEVFTTLYLFKLFLRLPDGLDSKNEECAGIFSDVKKYVTLDKQKRKMSQDRVDIEIHWQFLQHTYYAGFNEYVDWLIMLLRHDNSKTSEIELKRHAKTILPCLELCEQQKGIWDGSVQKHVQVLEVLHGLDTDSSQYLYEAETVLQGYETKNPENPRASKLLLEFYEKYIDLFGREKVMETLEKISEKWPRDPLVLELIEAKGERDCLHNLERLFYLLDQAALKNQLKPWELLARMLVENLKESDSQSCKFESHRSTFLEILKKCWAERYDYWPQYHFVSYDCLTCNDIGIYKASVALILLGKDHNFCQKIRAIRKQWNKNSEPYQLLRQARKIKVDFETVLSEEWENDMNK